MKMIIIFIISLLLIFGFVAFASKPFPVYGGLSLVVSGGLGCAMVVRLEDVFLGFMVLKIYLGGMFMVFGYTAAMATEEYPETLVGNAMAFSSLLFLLFMELMWYFLSGDVHIKMYIELIDFDWHLVS